MHSFCTYSAYHAQLWLCLVVLIALLPHRFARGKQAQHTRILHACLKCVMYACQMRLRQRNCSNKTHATFVRAQVLWQASIYLEAVAILPQLTLIMRTKNIDNLTGNYIALLGAYRGFYILNWIYRFFTEKNYVHVLGAAQKSGSSKRTRCHEHWLPASDCSICVAQACAKACCASTSLLFRLQLTQLL